MAAGMFLFEHVFWSQYEGEESPVTSIPETDAKEAGLTEGRDANREGEGPEGLKGELGQPPLFSFCSQALSRVTKMEWEPLSSLGSCLRKGLQISMGPQP